MIRKFTFLLLLNLFTALVFAQPANDNCTNATPVIIPNSGNVCVTGTLTGATDDGFYSACETAGSKEVWFTYIASGSNNTITAAPTGGTPASNLVVNVTSNNCSSNVLNTCNAASTANGTATATWAYAAGTQVWISVSSTTNSGGTFRLCVTSITTPPSTGKDCSTAAPVCNSNPFTAPVAAGSNGYRPPCFGAVLQQPIIFEFSVAQGGLLNWRAQPVCGAPHANSTEFDWAVYDITGGCPGTVVACNYNYTGSGLFGFPTTSPQGMQGGPGTGCYDTVSTGLTANEICPGVTVVAGNTYIIILDQFTTGNSCSVNFDFNGSTFEFAPSSVFTINPSVGCGSTNVTFTNSSLGASAYSWAFGDGTTSSVQNPPAKTYSNPGTYLVSLSTTANSGCTDVTSQSVQVFASPSLTTVDDTICTGGQATVSATANVSGGTYSWSPGGYNTSTINVSPGANTTYTVTYTSPDNCTATATVNVVVNTSNFTINAGSDITICANQSISLSGSVSPAGNYTYSWTPTATLQNATTLTPVASPTVTTTYTLTVASAGGCSKTDDVVVSVSGVGIPTTATVNPTVVCPGQQVQLNVSVLPVTCGPSPTCQGGSLSSSMGSGTTPQPGTQLQPPTLFGNYLKSGRNQMLYTAAELTSAVGTACVIRQIYFNIAIFNSNAQLLNFTIKMACTNATSLTTWEQNLTTVFAAASFQPGPGAWSSGFSLTTPFAWDGVSNLIVDVCWNNPQTFGNQNNKAECTNTAFTSYLYSFANTDQCGTNTAPTTSTLRPNMKLNTCAPDINNYTVSWVPSTGTVSNPAIANPTANPMVATTYTVTVANPSGTCPGIDVVNVQVDNSTVSAGPDVNSCPGAAVTLNATISGTILPGPASYVWTKVDGTSVGTGQSITVNPTVNTTYVVTLNGGGCVKTDTMVVTIGSLTPTATPRAATCYGANNGTVKALSATGSSPFTYNWSANAATGNVDSAVNLAPGTYQVTVTDATGCSGSATASVTQPTQVSFTSATINDSCNGGTQGRITITPAGGTPGYTYVWSHGPTTATVTGLTAGNYSVTVMDANMCSATGSFVITEPSPIVFLGAAIQNVRCYNDNTGRITVSNNGGTGVFTYAWSHSASVTTNTASNLTAGTYTVTVSDANHCTLSNTYNVTQPASGLTFGASNITGPTCFGFSNGSATVNTSGGAGTIRYLWTPSAQTTQTATNLSAQSYTVVATDDSSCTATTTVVVTQPLQIQIAGAITPVSCAGGNDGAVDITVTNGVSPYTYSWTTTAVTEDISGLNAGNYTVTVTDNNSCTALSSFTVTQPAALVINNTTVVDVACYGQSTGSITVVHNGGVGPYTFTWSPAGPNSDTNPALAAGTYSLTITDSHACSITTTKTVAQPAAALAFGAPAINDVGCNGATTGSISVVVTGGTVPAYVYSWSHNAALNNATASNLAAGNYTVTVTDGNNCSLSASYSVGQPSAITFGAQTIVPVSCFGGSDGSAQITPTGGTGGPNYTYTWNGVPGNNPQTGLAANTYTVVVTDVSNCSYSTTVVVPGPDQLVVDAQATPAFCNGSPSGMVDAVVIGGTPGYSYTWAPNGETTASITGVPAGLYAVTVTDSKGCTGTDAANVGEPPALTLNILPADIKQVSCPGEKDGSITPHPQGGTIPYSFSATQDGSNFVFPDANGVIGGLASGFYAVIVNDNNGCTIVDTAFVPAPVSDVYQVSTEPTSCYGSGYSDGRLTVSGGPFQNGPFSFSVDGGPMQFSNDFFGLTAGTHTILARNNFGCDTTLQAVVGEPVDAVVEILPGDTTLDLGQSIQLASIFGPYADTAIVSYSWSPTLGLSCIDCPNPVATPYSKYSNYILTITYNDHCKASAGMNILVEGGKPVYIPNSFSPNGDGNNDVFQIYGSGIKTIELKIFNRWGELIYQTNNQFSGWDGTYKGVMQNPAVFVYEVSITYLNDKQDKQVGSITLIR